MEVKLHCLYKATNSLPKETAMKKIVAVLRYALPAAFVIAGLCYVGPTAIAQNSNPHSVASAQDQMQQPNNQKPAAETKTFAGKIVKHGNMLVLSDAEG